MTDHACALTQNASMGDSGCCSHPAGGAAVPLAPAFLKGLRSQALLGVLGEREC
jgi:hypothetical protein